MVTKRTPGPWHWVNPENDQPWIDEPFASLRTVQTFGENKTDIREGKRYTSWALPKFILDCEALSPEDARLIAAAPELLDALRRLVDRDLRFSDKWLDTGLITRDDILQAREAIAKATGEAK